MKRFGRMVRQRWQRWLQRRIPPSRKVTLDQRRIFIFPTGYGFLFLLIAALLFIGGINYENNLLLGFSFLLVGLFLIAILHTFRNLAGVTLVAGGMRPGFAGARGALEVRVQGGAHAHRSLWLRWPAAVAEEVSVEPGQQQSLWLSVRLSHRGRQDPGRLRVETRYPLGLLRSWSLVDLDHLCLAWPRPLPGGECPASGGENDAGQQHQRGGNEEFEGLRSYVAGDSLRLVDWKSYARGRGLNTKQFSDPAEGRLWLEWQRLPGLDPESRYSRLCFWVLELDRAAERYGLVLPDGSLEPDLGPLQRERALEMLALSGEGGG
ncbi:DUF58 domain-containing protein [Alcanivorax sp. 1008]|uniref:DUF58 domain-containing protein n=1 Tax=Alcanivorax sp. 1008 TaxID=2816853 RepID=UPI001E563711|nr:DUF58 domain-containing protein [Alcanivorax sp. 1008]